MNGLSLRRPLKRLAHALHRGRRPVTASHRHRGRLVLESLEGRWVPSTVTNLNDAGAGSLRQAILDSPAGGTVDFQPGLTGTITLTSGELLLNKDLTITGPGADVLTVSGNNASRVFEVAAASTVAVSGLTITQGQVISSSTALGGGIDNAGTLGLLRCTVTGSGAFGFSLGNSDGGGIYNSGTLTLTDSTVSGNSTGGAFSGAGGGIDNEGTAMIINSTISGNSAGDQRHSQGGGLYNGGTLTITNSTVSGNIANNLDGTGGGLYNAGTLTVTNSTLSGNTANGVTSPGGGLVDSAGHAATLRDTIVAHNTDHGGAPDVSGSVNSQGHNLIGSSQGGSGYADSDLLNMDPLLGPLADNGGPTFTMALLPGSPAIDAGDNTGAPRWDQRGPGFPRIVNGTIDIGAFEVQAHVHGHPTGQPLPDPIPVQTSVPLGAPLLAQPPGLPAAPAALLDAAVPAGQVANAIFVAAVDQGQADAPVELWLASDLALLAGP